MIQAKIVQIYNESYQVYGAPKITEMLIKQGIHVAEKLHERRRHSCHLGITLSTNHHRSRL
ncbi:IS3 family transposase [Anoxynatronum buryatiense]